MIFVVVFIAVSAAVLRFFGVGWAKAFIGIILASAATFVAAALNPAAFLPAALVCIAGAALIVNIPDFLRR